MSRKRSTTELIVLLVHHERDGTRRLASSLTWRVALRHSKLLRYNPPHFCYSLRRIMDVYFYEAFEEEVAALRRHLPKPSFLPVSATRQSRRRAIGNQTHHSLAFVHNPWFPGVGGKGSRDRIAHDGLRSSRWTENPLRLPPALLQPRCGGAGAPTGDGAPTKTSRQQVAQFPKFHRDGLTGQECGGKHLLVVGVGSIGAEVVKIAQALGMEARGVDLVQRHDSVSYVSIEEGLPCADIVVCAMNLTDANAGYFRYETLKRAKHGVVFVNIARGEALSHG